MKNLLYILIFALVFQSCNRDDDTQEELSPEPKISFVSITPQEVENFNNSISLIVKYKDNNGDIGFSDPDEYALWVKDSRLDSADWYHVPPMAPLGKNLIIEGELEVVLNSMFILGNGNEEIVTLTVKLRDRANNWSNIINTTPVTIKK